MIELLGCGLGEAGGSGSPRHLALQSPALAAISQAALVRPADSHLENGADHSFSWASRGRMHEAVCWVAVDHEAGNIERRVNIAPTAGTARPGVRLGT